MVSQLFYLNGSEHFPVKHLKDDEVEGREQYATRLVSKIAAFFQLLPSRLAFRLFAVEVAISGQCLRNVLLHRQQSEQAMGSPSRFAK